APLKHCLDSTGAEWAPGALVAKPAAVFTSTSTTHRGTGPTLLSMMRPPMHHRMLLLGTPVTEPALGTTTSGAPRYGASHLTGSPADNPVTDGDRSLARMAGKRLAESARRLEASQ